MRRAQPRRVVVVGDSIVLGAEGPLRARFGASGWEFGFDAQVSRTTADGAEIVGVRRGEMTDSLVVGLGANDAGNPATFRARVRAVLDAAAGVPHVYWLSLAEVRNEYAPANQILREEIAGRPGCRRDRLGDTCGGRPGTDRGRRVAPQPVGRRSHGIARARGRRHGRSAATTRHQTTATPTGAPPAAASSTTAARTGTDGRTHAAAPRRPRRRPRPRRPPRPLRRPGSPSPRRPAWATPVSRSTVAAGSVGVSDVGRTVGGGLAALVLVLVLAGVALGAWSLVAPAGRHRPAAEVDDGGDRRTDVHIEDSANLSVKLQVLAGSTSMSGRHRPCRTT